MKLLIGNKNYSSWSMRPWVLLTQFDLPFEEVRIPFDGFSGDSRFKAAVAERSPAGKVPVLVEDDGFAVNIEAALPEVGARVLADNAAARADLARMVALWQEALAASGGPFLFGEFSIVDAYFAPVVMRMVTYALPVPADVAAYVARAVAAKGTAAWIRGALAEKEFLQFEEPYRTSRD